LNSLKKPAPEKTKRQKNMGEVCSISWVSAFVNAESAKLFYFFINNPLK